MLSDNESVPEKPRDLRNGDLLLLVEDSPDDEELTLRALARAGISVRTVTAHDGQEALDWFFGQGQYADRDTSVQPRVVLLDLKLPKRSGHEVLEQLRRDPRTRRIPVVVLTSSTEESDKTRAYDLAANSYVRKPVNFDAFLEVARQLGKYWLTTNEVPS